MENGTHREEEQLDVLGRRTLEGMEVGGIPGQPLCLDLELVNSGVLQTED